jgi:predicted small lipoprotein YifL
MLEPLIYTRRMKPSARILFASALLFSVAGCGLKGPLYLPDEQPQEVPASTTSSGPVLEGSKVRTLPAPQSQNKDRERDSAAPSQSQPTPASPVDPDRPAPTSPPGP